MKTNILTENQAEKLKLKIDKKQSYHVGELYPYIFDSDKEITFTNFKLNVAIIYLGAYELSPEFFPKIKCPICGKEEVLVPYFCGASILSGAHVIKFYCTNCKRKVAMNNQSSYYHLIRDYVLENQSKLDKCANLSECTSLTNTVFVFS